MLPARVPRRTSFLLLVLQLVEVADAGQRFADVADVVLLHAAAAVEQGFAKFGQRVAVRRGEPDAGDHNPLMVVEGSWAWICRRSGFSLTDANRQAEALTYRGNLEPIGKSRV